MATPRINMRQIRNILRLKLDSQLSIRQIKTSTQVSVGSIQKILVKAVELGLSWPLPENLDDNQLAQMFYPRAELGPPHQLRLRFHNGAKYIRNLSARR